MDQEISNKTVEVDKLAPAAGGEESITDCCRKTITDHAEHNPMMVCDKCKQIVKIFKDTGSFEKYLKFCQGRGRSVKTGQHEHYDVITFNVYDTFNR